MAWLESACTRLEQVDMKSELRKVGYANCWEDVDFRRQASQRFSPDAEFVPEEDEREYAVQHKCDQEDDVMVSLMVQEADAPGQDQFYLSQ